MAVKIFVELKRRCERLFRSSQLTFVWQEKLGIPVVEQRLKYSDRELQDDTVISEVGISNALPRIYLEASCLDMELENLARTRKEDIEELREKVHAFIIYKLDEPRTRGTAIPFADISKGLDQFEWSSSAPKWCIATGGLNFEGKCTNSSCCAYNQTVIIQRGYGTFNLCREPEDFNICPTCKTKNDEDVTACWLTRCCLTWEGERYLDGTKTTEKCSGGPDTFGDKPYRTKEGVECLWKKLSYTVEPA
jgi:hypothetical protein